MDDKPGGPGSADLAILAYVGALLVVWAPAFSQGLLTPRIAVLLVGLGPGLVVLAGLARRGDGAARWAAAYLAWALLSVAVANQPRLAFLGTLGLDVGWVFLAGYLGAWGLGRRLGPAGRAALPGVILVGLGVNAFFAVIEVALDPAGDLATEAGRAHGLMSNSLFLGGLLMGGLALLGHRVGTGDRRRLPLFAGVVFVSMAVNLTGSRVALIGGAVLAVVAAVVTARAGGHAVRSRPVVLAGGLVAAGLVLGFALSLPMQNSESGASRLGETEATSGYQSRAIMWRAGVGAAAERPITGWGPGRFTEATSPRVTADFVKAEGPDKLFYDAHNLVVENLVAVGVVGLVLLGGFTLAAFRHARGPLAWFGGGVALTWLFNPVSVSTGAVALVAIGAAWVTGRPGEPGVEATVPATDADADADADADVASEPGAEAGAEPEADVVPAPLHRGVVVGRAVGAALAVAGAVLGIRLLWGDALVDQGIKTGDVDTLRRAEQVYPRDAVVTGILAEARSIEADLNRTPANRRAVMASSHRATELDPTRAYWWVLLGTREFTYGTGSEEQRLDRAEAAFNHALELNPWSALAIFGLRGVADKRGDDGEVARLTARLCEVDICEPPAS